MNKTQKILSGILAIMLVALIVNYVSSKKSTPAPVVETPVATTTPATTTIPVATSTTSIPKKPATHNTYTSSTYGYSITYPVTLSVKEPVATSTLFVFPDTDFKGSTLTAADISVVETTTSCDHWIGDDINTFPVEQTVIKNGISFDIRNVSDAGAGNFYYNREYSTMKNGLCYRIAYHDHISSPSATFGDDKAKIDTATALNASLQQKMLGVLDQMVGTFVFTR